MSGNEIRDPGTRVKLVQPSERLLANWPDEATSADIIGKHIGELATVLCVWEVGCALVVTDANAAAHGIWGDETCGVAAWSVPLAALAVVCRRPEAAIERVRPVVELLAYACDREGLDGDGLPIDVHDLLLDLGRIGTSFADDAAWLRSLLPTADATEQSPPHTTHPASDTPR